NVYNANDNWFILFQAQLLKMINIGTIWYDGQPCYELQIDVLGDGKASGLSFIIRYSKVSDQVGQWYARLGLPEALRTFECGNFTIMLPSVEVTVYTNGDWQVTLGWPNKWDFRESFSVQSLP